MTTVAWPASIEAQDDGVDEFGEARADVMVCTCGARRRVEFFDPDEDRYVAVDPDRLQAWAEDHRRCESWDDHDARLYAESVKVACS